MKHGTYFEQEIIDDPLWDIWTFAYLDWFNRSRSVNVKMNMRTRPIAIHPYPKWNKLLVQGLCGLLDDYEANKKSQWNFDHLDYNNAQHFTRLRLNCPQPYINEYRHYANAWDTRMTPPYRLSYPHTREDTVMVWVGWFLLGAWYVYVSGAFFHATGVRFLGG